jgi:hypothetical protein
MSDLKRLEKQVNKAKEAVEARRGELDNAITLYGTAVSTHAVALDAFEQAEALEAARELRAKK